MTESFISRQARLSPFQSSSLQIRRLRSALLTDRQEHGSAYQANSSTMIQETLRLPCSRSILILRECITLMTTTHRSSSSRMQLPHSAPSQQHRKSSRSDIISLILICYLIYRPKREKSQWDGIFFFITSSEVLTHTVPIAKISFGTV